MTLAGLIPLRKKAKDTTSAENMEVLPPKVQLHSQFAHLNIEDPDEYGYSSQRLKVLRRQNLRVNKSPPPPAPRSSDRNKLTVVLDLDETLVHSKISCEKRAAQDLGSKPESFSNELETFQITLADGEKVLVCKRPGLDEFLRQAASKYEIMAYTAGLKQYAEPLLNWLDPEKKIFRHRFYRDSCLYTNGYYVKDLAKTQRCLKRTVLVDNNLCCFLPQLCNGIPISSFYDDATDDALTVLLEFLESLEKEQDVRQLLFNHFKLTDSLSRTRDMLLG